MVKLYNIDTYPDVLLDSTVIKDEKFQLEGTRTFEYPKYCRLVVDMTPDEPDQRKKTLKAYRFLRIIQPWNSSVRWTVCRLITGKR